MNNKLREFALENSFARFVYKGTNGIVLNVFFVIMLISMFLMIGSFAGMDFDSSNCNWNTTFISGIIFMTSVFGVYIVGNKASKKILDSRIFQVKQRDARYRSEVKKIIQREFFRKNGAFSKMKIDEAIEILVSNRIEIKSEYSKIVLVFGSIAGIVWYQFIEAMFNLFKGETISETIFLFLSLMVFCMLILMIYFYIRFFVSSFTNIGKIDSFVGILQEFEYEMR